MYLWLKDTTVFVVYLVLVNTLCNIIGIIGHKKKRLFQHHKQGN